MDENGIRLRASCREINFRTHRKKRQGVKIGGILCYKEGSQRNSHQLAQGSQDQGGAALGTQGVYRATYIIPRDRHRNEDVWLLFKKQKRMLV